MILHQIRSTDGTGTLSYFIADEKSRAAVIIDPNIKDLDEIIRVVKDHRATVTHAIETHTHVDHISATNELKKLFPLQLIMHENTKNKWKVVDQGDKFGIGDILRENATLEVDRYVNDGDTLTVDSMACTFLHTPGHTDNHLSVLIGDNVFTGDLLLIGQAGRSDLPGGSADEQYDSLTQKIMTLPDNTKIWPGHDYEENTFAYLRDERKTNPFLRQRSKEEYLKFVADFFPPLAESVEGGSVTVQCGTKRVVAHHNEPFRSVTADELESMITSQPDLFLLDVREPFELTAYGKIPNVVNIPTGEVVARVGDLPKEKSAAIVCICQSGSRSYEVANYLATRAGYTNVYNLEGGTSGWMFGGKAVQRSATKVSR
jgi:glyoxylase-like metal-dependent hydrolase (beta-lactamase superfamily II)/rhodanese-related sulfurtransferase